MGNNWPKVKLGEVLRRGAEVVDLQPATEYREITIRLWGKGVVLRGLVSGAEVAASRRAVARQGQFILSRIDARNGAMGIVSAELDGAIISNDFPVFDIATDRLLPGYMGWMCKTAAFVDICQKASEGTTNRVRLQEDKFLATGIALPPLPEQHRIMARIEDLSLKIEEGQAIRKQTTVETKALWINALRSTFSNSSGPEVHLEETCTAIIDNLHSNPQYADNGIACVRSPDVGWGTLNLETALKTDETEYHRRTIRGEPQPDDIVLVREGGGTGKAALVLPNQRFSLGQRVMMLRPNKNRVIPKFFLYQLLSPVIQEEEIGRLCKGSASPHLNIGALRKFPFRLPPLSEQTSIVAELDSLQTLLDSLKRQQAESSAGLDALLPSMLDKAFRGSCS